MLGKLIFVMWPREDTSTDKVCVKQSCWEICLDSVSNFHQTRLLPFCRLKHVSTRMTDWVTTGPERWCRGLAEVSCGSVHADEASRVSQQGSGWDQGCAGPAYYGRVLTWAQSLLKKYHFLSGGQQRLTFTSAINQDRIYLRGWNVAKQADGGLILHHWSISCLYHIKLIFKQTLDGN